MKKTMVLLALATFAGCAGLQRREPSLTLEFRTASQSPGPGLWELPVAGSGQKLYVSDDVVLSNEDVVSSQVVSASNGPAIEIAFTSEGAEKLEAVTEDNIGKPIAILVDGQVLSAPVVRSKITGGEALITGRFSREEAKRIARGIVPH